MNNESKTLRNVCVPRLLKGAGKATIEAVIQYESWDPVPGHQLPVEDTGLWKMLCALERDDTYVLCGASGVSLCPHWVCLHARACVRGESQHRVNTQCASIMSGALETMPRGEYGKTERGLRGRVVRQSSQNVI